MSFTWTGADCSDSGLGACLDVGGESTFQRTEVGKRAGKSSMEASFIKCVVSLTVWPSHDIIVEDKGIRRTKTKAKPEQTKNNVPRVASKNIY